jgi:hypothetical protein
VNSISQSASSRLADAQRYSRAALSIYKTVAIFLPELYNSRGNGIEIDSRSVFAASPYTVSPFQPQRHWFFGILPEENTQVCFCTLMLERSFCPVAGALPFRLHATAVAVSVVCLLPVSAMHKRMPPRHLRK